MGKFIKTANQIAEQIERWFLLYHKKEKSSFNGSELFTIFNHLYFEQQNDLLRRMELNKYEIPVLVLRLKDNEFLVNTTERFLRVSSSTTESVYYTDFKSHRGYGSIADAVRFNVKIDGNFADFGLEKQNGEITYWLIPTGRPGYGFWNVTKKFGIVGRNYIIKEYEGL